MYTRIFQEKSYILIEFLLACAIYGVITSLLWFLLDETFYIGIIYCGVFLFLQIIWQIMQYRREINSNEDIYELFACKNAIVFISFIIIGATFFSVHIIYFHPIFSYRFQPLQNYTLVNIARIKTEPDQYGTISHYYDEYYELKFSFPYWNTNGTTAIGCGCGVTFGSLDGTLGSPISPVHYSKEKYWFSYYLTPTWLCICSNEQDCNRRFIEENTTTLNYLILGDPEKALANNQCPPTDLNFIQIYDNTKKNPFMPSMIVFFTLVYIPMAFFCVNYILNYAKSGFIAYIDSQNDIDLSGVKLFWWLYFIKWVLSLTQIAFLITIKWQDFPLFLGLNISLLLFPGIMIGIFVYKFDRNVEVISELKRTMKEMMKYGYNATETVENFVKLVVVMANITIQGILNFIFNIISEILLRGITNTIFYFSLINPEFYSELNLDFGHGPAPEIISTAVLNNVTFFCTGLFHGILFNVVILLYQLQFGYSISGILSISFGLLYFPFTIYSLLCHIIHFKSLKKALCCRNIFFITSEGIRNDRFYVRAYFRDINSQLQMIFLEKIGHLKIIRREDICNRRDY